MLREGYIVTTYSYRTYRIVSNITHVCDTYYMRANVPENRPQRIKIISKDYVT